jgi:hypothetical protein
VSNPWDETCPLENIDYFVDRQTGLEGLVKDIAHISGLNSEAQRIHVIGRRGSGKTSVINILEQAAISHLITVKTNLQESTGLPYVPRYKRDAGRRLQEIMLNLVMVTGIVDALWMDKYDRGWYPLTRQGHRLWTYIRRRGIEIQIPAPAMELQLPLRLPAEPNTKPENLLFTEFRKVIGHARHKRQRGVALFLDEAESLVTTPFLKALADGLSTCKLPVLLVVATKDPFLTLLQDAASNARCELSDSEIEDIDSVKGRFRTVNLRPYKIEDDQEREDVIQKAILKVLADYNSDNRTNYEFHMTSARVITLRSAGHLYLINLLCRYCFDECLKYGRQLVYLTEGALKAALSQCRQQYEKHIDPEDKESGGNLVWEETRQIEEASKGEA